MIRMTSVRFAVCATLPLLALSGCGHQGGAGNGAKIVTSSDHSTEPALVPGKYGGSLVYAQPGDPKTFNQIVADDVRSQDILTPLYDTLEFQNPYTLKYEPRLAEALPKISADGLTYTYHLRPNLKWSDGQPLTADDFLFTLDVTFDPKIQSVTQDWMLVDVDQPDGTVKRVPFKYVKLDDRTLQFTLPTKWAPAESMFAFTVPLPKHILYAAYKAGRFNTAYGIDTPPSQLVSCGPYVISEYKPSQRIVYKPNPFYWRKTADGKPLPYMGTYTYQIVQDYNATTLAFRNGQNDVLDLTPDAYPAMKRAEANSDYTIIDRGPSWGFSYLCFNINPNAKIDKNLVSLFSDVRFRQAVSYAVNRPRICDDIYQGLAKPLYSPLTPANTPYYNPNVQQYPYDPAKAKQMLLAIGLTPGPDGKLQWHGQKVKFNIITSAENAQRKAMATIICNDLQNLGLDATFTAIDSNDLLRRLDTPPHDWQADIGGFVWTPEVHYQGAVWRSSGPLHIWWPSQTKPATAWEAHIDKDFTMGAHEIDPTKRKRYYDDWQKIASEQQALIPLVCEEQYTALRNHYGNVKPSSLYGVSGDVLWNIDELYDTRATGTSPHPVQ